MVSRSKIRDLRKQRGRTHKKSKRKKESPDWENIYDMGLKKHIKELYKRENIDAWQRVSAAGRWKDTVKKFLDSQPKISKYWKADTGKHALVLKPVTTQELARKDMARVVLKSVYYSEHAKRWYSTSRHGAIKASEAKELIAEASKAIE